MGTVAVALAVVAVVVDEVFTTAAQHEEVTETCGSLACSPAWSLETAGTLLLLAMIVVVSLQLARYTK